MFGAEQAKVGAVNPGRLVMTTVSSLTVTAVWILIHLHLILLLVLLQPSISITLSW